MLLLAKDLADVGLRSWIPAMADVLDGNFTTASQPTGVGRTHFNENGRLVLSHSVNLRYMILDVSCLCSNSATSIPSTTFLTER